MLIFYQKQKFIIFLTKIKNSGGGFGAGAGGDENLIINFYWPYVKNNILFLICNKMKQHK